MNRIIDHEPDEEVLKEMDKAETEVFDSVAASVVFLLNLGFDIKTIEQMIQETLNSAIEQIKEKWKRRMEVLNSPEWTDPKFDNLPQIDGVEVNVD